MNKELHKYFTLNALKTQEKAAERVHGNFQDWSIKTINRRQISYTPFPPAVVDLAEVGK